MAQQQRVRIPLRTGILRADGVRVPIMPGSAPPESEIDRALRERERMAAATIRQATIDTVSTETELQRTEAELRLVKLQAEIEKLRRETAVATAPPERGEDPSVKLILAVLESTESRLQAAEERARASEGGVASVLQALLDNTRQEAAELRARLDSAQQTPQSIMQQAKEYAEFARSLLPEPSAAPPQTDNQMALAYLDAQHRHRMDELEFNLRSAKSTNEQRIAAAAIDVERERIQGMVAGLNQILPGFAAAAQQWLADRASRSNGHAPATNGNGHAAAAPAAAAPHTLPRITMPTVECWSCGRSFGVSAPGTLPCPHCGTAVEVTARPS